MTQHDDGSRRPHDLSQLLREVGDAAHDAPLSSTDERLVLDVRRRATALRSRRTVSRALVAAAASAAVAVAGVAVVTGFGPWGRGTVAPATRAIEASPAVRDADLLACGAPVDAVVAGSGDVGATLRVLSPGAPARSARTVWPRAVLRLDSPRAVVPLDASAAYLVRDGRVVSAVRGQGTTAGEYVEDGVQHQATFVEPLFGGADCGTDELLEPGTYDGVVVLQVLADGVRSEVVSERFDVQIAETGLPDAVPDATFPACGAPEPAGPSGDLTLSGAFAGDVTLPSGSARGSELVLSNDGQQIVRGTFSSGVTTVLVLDGRVVGTASRTGTGAALEAGPGGRMSVPITIDTTTCGDDDGAGSVVPDGRYDVWVWAPLTVDGDDEPTPMAGRIASVRLSADG